MANEVRKYINERFPKFISQYTFWHKGKSRGGWKASNNLQLFILKKGDGRFYVSMATKEKWEPDMMSFRRVPHRWLPVYDKALTKDEQHSIREKQAVDTMLHQFSH